MDSVIEDIENNYYILKDGKSRLFLLYKNYSIDFIFKIIILVKLFQLLLLIIAHYDVYWSYGKNAWQSFCVT